MQKYYNPIIVFNQSLELSLNNNSPFRSKRCHLINCDCEIFVVGVSKLGPDTNWTARKTGKLEPKNKPKEREGKEKLKSNRSLRIEILLLFCRNTERGVRG